jgi:long-chain acyl-CoA synthetase
MTQTLINLEFDNIADLIEHCLLKYADKPAFSCLGQTLSFAQIDAQSKALKVCRRVIE